MPGKRNAICPPPAARPRGREPDVAVAAPRPAAIEDLGGERAPLGGRIEQGEADRAVAAERAAGAARRAARGARPPSARRARRTSGPGSAAARTARPRRGAGPAGRLEHDVGVDAAEAERVDPGAARQLVPRLGGAGDAEPGPVEVGVGLLAVQGGRQHPVVERQRRLDQAGGAGRGHGVADHRLDRAQRRRAGRVALAEEPAQGRRARPRRRPGCRCRGPRSGRPRPGSRPRRARPARAPATWPSTRGPHQARRPAVARHPGAADDRVDAIAVALGVGQPAQHDDRRRPRR